MNSWKGRSRRNSRKTYSNSLKKLRRRLKRKKRWQKR